MSLPTTKFDAVLTRLSLEYLQRPTFIADQVFPIGCSTCWPHKHNTLRHKGRALRGEGGPELGKASFTRAE